MGLLDRIQSKIELFRLEQRYTNRHNRRSAFISDAIYVDGEYVYAASNNTGSSSRTNTTTQTMQSTHTMHSVRSDLTTNTTNTTNTSNSNSSTAAPSRYAKSANRRSVGPSQTFGDIETQIAAARGEARVEGEQGEGQEKGGLQRRWSRSWGKTRREEKKRRSMAVLRETRWEDGA